MNTKYNFSEQVLLKNMEMTLINVIKHLAVLFNDTLNGCNGTIGDVGGNTYHINETEIIVNARTKKGAILSKVFPLKDWGINIDFPNTIDDNIDHLAAAIVVHLFESFYLK